jgi:hypothetical protein
MRVHPGLSHAIVGKSIDPYDVLCSSRTAMLVALGPRLQRLTLSDCWGHPYHERQCGLVPAMLAHCPLLAHLAVDCLGLGKDPAVSVMTLVLHNAMLCKIQQMVCSAEAT